MEGIVVARETVDERLLWRCLLTYDPVGFAAFRDRLVARRSGGHAREACTCDLGSQIERRGL